MKRSTALALGAGALAGGALALLGRKKRQSREALRIESPLGIDEEEYVYIGGIEQFLCHRGQNRRNPVLLFLHGGPGSPELPFMAGIQTAWEDRVTVVHWDQRGAGKTFLKNPGETGPLSLERMVEDCDEVVSYLRRKYRQEQILILGHSWGTVLGTAYIKRYPEAVAAYIGVGQVVNMRENEYVGFEKTMELALEAGNQRDVRRLQALEPYPGPFAHFIDSVYKVRRLQGEYGLATTVQWDMVRTVLESPFYSLRDITSYLRPGVAKAQRALLEDLFDFDLPALGSAYRVPFFLIHGKDDYQTPFPLADAYFETVEAPVRGFYPIAGAGHFTMLDQREAFTKALFSILDRLDECRTVSEDIGS